jgi:hypothetical protein
MPGVFSLGMFDIENGNNEKLKPLAEISAGGFIITHC